jgi:hypothetical protein
VEERRHRSEQFNAVYGAWPWAGDFFKRPLKHWSLQAAIKPQTHCLRSGGFAS